MPTFQVIRELAATRCEICHQADLFDADSGRCGRCDGLALPQILSPPARTAQVPWWERILWLNGWRGTLSLLFLLAVFLGLFSFVGPWIGENVVFEPQSRFRSLSEILEPQGGAPRLVVQPDQTVVVKGLLADDKPVLPRQFEEFSGIQTGEPVRKSFGLLNGVKFRIQTGADDPDCFLPRIDRFSPDEQGRIQKLLSEETPVSIKGHWDPITQMIFVDRIVFQPEKKTASGKIPSARLKSLSNPTSKFVPEGK